jgi:hypothetical protein
MAARKSLRMGERLSSERQRLEMGKGRSARPTISREHR